MVRYNYYGAVENEPINFKEALRKAKENEKSKKQNVLPKGKKLAAKQKLSTKQELAAKHQQELETKTKKESKAADAAILKKKRDLQKAVREKLKDASSKEKINLNKIT